MNYVLQTKTRNLLLKPEWNDDDKFEILAYTDSDYAADKND